MKNNVIKLPAGPGQSPKAMGGIENFVAALNQQDKEAGISKGSKLRRATFLTLGGLSVPLVAVLAFSVPNGEAGKGPTYCTERSVHISPVPGLDPKKSVIVKAIDTVKTENPDARSVFDDSRYPIDGDGVSEALQEQMGKILTEANPEGVVNGAELPRTCGTFDGVQRLTSVAPGPSK